MLGYARQLVGRGGRRRSSSGLQKLRTTNWLDDVDGAGRVSVTFRGTYHDPEKPRCELVDLGDEDHQHEDSERCRELESAKGQLNPADPYDGFLCAAAHDFVVTGSIGQRHMGTMMRMKVRCGRNWATRLVGAQRAHNVLWVAIEGHERSVCLVRFPGRGLPAGSGYSLWIEGLSRGSEVILQRAQIRLAY
jgi:hypothetical protein